MNFGSPVFLISLVVTVVVGHALVCLYVVAFPQDAARELSTPNRSFIAWIYLLALRRWRGDTESDLQSGLDVETLAANCRRRAVIGLALGGFSLAMLGFAVNHMLPTTVAWR